MTERKQLFYFLLLCLFGALALAYFIFQPFLNPLILAAVAAFLFQPLYKKSLKLTGGKQSLAALITTILAIIIVVLPVTFLGIQIFNESKQLYTALASGGVDSFIKMIEQTAGRLHAFLPIPEDFKIDFDQYARQATDLLVQNLGAAFSSLAKILLDLLVFLMAFFFLLKDGRELKNYFVAISPLNDTDDELIVSRLKRAVSSVVKGSLSISLIQGTLTGIGFALFGVPNPVLWSIVAAVAALIPGIGTALVITPAIFFLFFTGSTIGAIGLLIWGVTAVGLIDNVLGPRLIGRGMQLHQLTVFLAVLGGLTLFGPIGFLLGPLVISLCLTLIDIYFSLRTRGNKK